MPLQDQYMRGKLRPAAGISHALCVEFSRTGRFSAQYWAKIAGNGHETAI
jgi:hypothetical protein